MQIGNSSLGMRGGLGFKMLGTSVRVQYTCGCGCGELDITVGRNQGVKEDRMNEHRILCFVGTLRADSYNRLLPWAAEAAPERMTIETFDLVPIPLYNQDLDVGNGPELVARFREAISRASGLRIATPKSGSGSQGCSRTPSTWPLGRRPGLGCASRWL